MNLRRRMAVAGSALALVTGLGILSSASSASAAETRTWVLQPGADLQRAVDRANPGDTLSLRPGSYTGGVLISKSLRIVGSGPGTKIIPGGPAQGPCAGSGLCVVDPDVAKGIGVHDVSISNLQASGFAGIGIVAFGVDGFNVTNVVGRMDGEYGIAAFQSKHITMTGNRLHGDGGEAGIYIGESADTGAKITGNESTGWLIGYFMRDSRQGDLVGNIATDNCTGVLGLDIGPNAPGARFGSDVPGGDWKVTGNFLSHNNRACPAGDENPPISGHGVLLVGVDGYHVVGNTINVNSPTGPDGFTPSGVTIVASPFGPTPRATSGLTLRGNQIRGNALDVFWDGMGAGNQLRPNDCRTSTPAWIC